MEDLVSFALESFPIETPAARVECSGVRVEERGLVGMVCIVGLSAGEVIGLAEEECVLVAAHEMPRGRELLSQRIAALRDHPEPGLPSDFFAKPLVSDETDAALRREIGLHVRAGYESAAEVEERLAQLVFERVSTPDDEILERYRLIVRDELARHDADAETWPTPTMNVRLSRAFEALRGHGILAIENAGWDLSLGWDRVQQERKRDAPDAWAATFFHWQDVERAVLGEGLNLAFGTLSPDESQARQSADAARAIVEVLNDHGVPARWSGSVNERIEVGAFEWRRRRG